MVSRYCSRSCNGKAYKEKQKKEKLQKYDEEQNARPLQIAGAIGEKAFLSPSEAATLLGISRATMYRHMASGLIHALQLRGRTIIRRSDIEKLFDETTTYKKRTYGRKVSMLYYTTQEIMDKYQIQKKTIYRRCQLNNIPKIEEGNRVYYNRAQLYFFFGQQSSLQFAQYLFESLNIFLCRCPTRDEATYYFISLTWFPHLKLNLF